MKGQGQGYVYVSGRSRPKGETNGKSGNLNNVCGQLYPRELDIPGNEVLCIFDADQASSGASFSAASSRTGLLSLFFNAEEVMCFLSASMLCRQHGPGVPLGGSD